MHSRLARRAAALSLLISMTAPGAQALTIDFNYSYDTNNFFAAGSNARLALEQAGGWFESHLTDDLLPITSGGGNSTSVIFRNPSVLDGNDLQFETLTNFSIAADTIMIVVGAIDLASASLIGNTSTLAVAQPGATSVSGSQSYIDDVFSRGQGANGTRADIINTGGTQSANDFALWGGMVSVDLDRNWSTDPNSSPLAGTFDLFSVLLHELGHVFGIGAGVDSWDNQVAGANFTGSAAVAAFGGNVPLNANRDHWAAGTQSTAVAGFEANGVSAGTAMEAALDPTLLIGTRKVLTELDVAALTDIGWEVSSATAVPLPPAGWLCLAGLAFVLRGRRHAA